MNEPLFRGFNRKENKWYYGFGWYEIDYTDEYLKENSLDPQAMLLTPTSPIECDLSSMGQYIGINDKFNSKVFSDDFVAISNDFNDEVIFSRVAWGGKEYPAFDLPNFDGYGMNAFAAIFHSDVNNQIEVLQNVYEEPELLKVIK